MPEKGESKGEMIKRLTEQFRKLLEEKLPEEPGTLEEIEGVTEEIGRDIKREVENECVGWHGSGYVGARTACSCGGVARYKTDYEKTVVTLSSELTIGRA